MKDSNDGGQRGPDYEELRQSGIYTIPALLKRLMPEQSFKPRDQGREVQVFLAYTEICRRRVAIRNRIRGLFERSELLSRIAGVDYVAPVTAQQSADEERCFHERKLRVLAARERDVHPERTLEYASKDYKLDVDDEMIRRQEFAKYSAQKMRMFIERGDFQGARVYIEGVRGNMKDPVGREVMEEVVRASVADAFTEIVQKNEPARVTAAFYELSAISRFCGEDLIDLLNKQKTTPEIRDAFLRELGGHAAKNPQIYEYVRDYLAELGFVERDKVDFSPEVRQGVSDLLKSALQQHPVVFHHVWRWLIRKGIISLGDEEKADMVYPFVVRWLEHDMGDSVFLYAKMRDRWAKYGFIDADEVDVDPEIGEAKKKQFKKWYDFHPLVYKILRYRWAELGIREPFEHEFLQSINYGKWLMNNGVPQLELGDFISGSVEGEKLNAQRQFEREVDMEIACVRKKYRALRDGLRNFLKKYPQFRHGSRIRVK